jgi:hypothetical protein
MIWGYGSDKFLVNGLGSIFISLLMLEQMHTLLAVPSQKDRENRNCRYRKNLEILKIF